MHTMHIMTLFPASRLMTFLRCNLAALLVGLMVVALPIAMQPPQRASAAPMTGFTRVETNANFTCALKSDTTVWCWGRNGSGQLGDGTTTDRSRPVQVANLTGVVSVDTGGNDFACALKSDETMWCWGSNGTGQLGDGTNTNRSRPVQVKDLTGVTQMATGYGHACAVKSNGTVSCWGWNHYYLLGNSGPASNIPVVVSGISTATQVRPGSWHTCAVLANATMSCWGYRFNTSAGLTGITLLSVSKGQHMCAIASEQILKCWGYNDHGQVGVNNTTEQASPTTVTGFADAVSISSNNHNTCLVKSDGTPWCWGWNAFGQVGVPGSASQLVPVVVSGVTGVSQISAGYSHTCAVLTDTTVKCWGDNRWGQLGNGTTTSSYNAVTVSAPPVALATPTSVTATATSSTLKSINVSWAANGNASSFTVKIYNSAGSSLLGTKTGVSGTSTTITSSTYGSIADNTSYKITVTAIGDGTNYLTSSESSQDSVTTNSLTTQTPVVLTSTSGTYGTDITLAISGGSGSGAVTYAVTTAGTAGCSITGGNTLRATSIGMCTVTATKAANGVYSADSSNATTVTFSAVIVTTTTTAAPALSIVIQAPVTTVAQGQASVATLAPTTTIPTFGANGSPAPTTTIAKSKTAVTTTLPQVVTTTTVGPPSVEKVAAGQTAVQVDGVKTEAKVSRQNNRMVVDAGSLTATLSGIDNTGKTLALDSDGNVHLSSGDVIKVSVGGFKPESIVEVWLFSTPIQLGSAVVDAKGTMNGTYKLPFGVKSGAHRVVVTAKLRNGKPTTFTFGILVGNISKTSTLTRVLIAIPISLAIGIGFLLPNQARRRKRRAAI
jgi:alpha-tubulin suppressor-like RCC1 family protein